MSTSVKNFLGHITDNYVYAHKLARAGYLVTTGTGDFSHLAGIDVDVTRVIDLPAQDITLTLSFENEEETLPSRLTGIQALELLVASCGAEAASPCEEPQVTICDAGVAMPSGSCYSINAAVQWAANNPGKVVCIVLGGVMLVVPMSAAAPILSAIGLSSAGPTAGYLFAAAQSVGAVGAGGFFATLQSAAMGGYGVGAVAGGVQLAGAFMAGLALWKGMQEKKEDDGEEQKDEEEGKWE